MTDTTPKSDLKQAAAEALPPRGTWWGLVSGAAKSWIDDYAPSMGAALSYYTVFSMAPLLLLVISIAGLVFGEDAARGAVFSELSGLMGPSASKAVEEVLAGLNKPGQGAIGTAIGMAVLLIGATTVFGELQDALDRIWRAPSRKKPSGLFSLVRSRFLSFGMILGVAFLLMVSLVLSAAVSALGSWWGGAFAGWEPLAQIINVAIGFLITTGGFALIYKLMPRVKVQWRDVWLGAAATALLFTLGRFLIGLYIGKSEIASAYGAAGSLIVVFVWVYYSAQIFLMGAELTWVYATNFGSMRGVAARVDEPPPPETSQPRRSEEVPVVAVPTGIPSELRPALPAPALPRRAAWTVLGVGVAVGAALSHAAARLIRPRYY